jgi:hypothetical protein
LGQEPKGWSQKPEDEIRVRSSDTFAGFGLGIASEFVGGTPTRAVGTTAIPEEGLEQEGTEETEERTGMEMWIWS